jgi:two-component system sensor histidine kinase SenX3
VTVIVAAIAVIAGIVVGVVMVFASSAARRRSVLPSASTPSPRNRDVMPAETVLHLLPTAAVLVDDDDRVRLANAAATELGIVKGAAIAVLPLTRLVYDARRTGVAQVTELTMDFGGFPRRVMSVRARAERLQDGEVALVVDDLTEAKRVESVRRDFVANVGHEIKTPVGALQLLAEAALDARDDPDAVQRFVGRMQHEAQRLSRLVQELLDLSRLQGGEPLPDATEVSVDAVLEEAVDRARLGAEAKSISIVRAGHSGVFVLGDETQLVTAVSNLLDNAVAYSPERTNVAMGVELRDGVVDITVTDQGIGIAKDQQQRIFERFYRVDPARSRATGGTGLGLAIVKHTIGNHGGEVSVWSREGSGSTFTIRLPAAGQREEAAAT